MVDNGLKLLGSTWRNNKLCAAEATRSTAGECAWKSTKLMTFAISRKLAELALCAAKCANPDEPTESST